MYNPGRRTGAADGRLDSEVVLEGTAGEIG